MGRNSQIYRVFVSSTSEDLYDYRAVARSEILNMQWHPTMMEHFDTSPNPTVQACKEMIKQCDAVLLLVAFRKGWTPDKDKGGNGVDSITALELEYARKHDIPVLAMMADKKWPGDLWEDKEKSRDWISQFRNNLNLPAKFFPYEEPITSDSERLPIFRTKVKEVLLAHREWLIKEAERKAAEREQMIVDSVLLENIHSTDSFFQEAKETIKDGQYIPFVGLGIYDDGPLNTQALIRFLQSQQNQEDLRCIASAAEYRERFSSRRDKLLDLLRQTIDVEFETENDKDSIPDVYKMIVRAPKPNLIVCTTYDLCLERFLKRNNKGYVTVTHIVNSRGGMENGKIGLITDKNKGSIHLADRLNIADSDRDYIIYRPLGSPLLNDCFDPDEDIDTVVITECDHLTFLGRLQHQHTQIPTRFSRYFQRRPLMFLGYGLDVWHYRLVMQVFQSIGGRGHDSPTLAVRIPASSMEDLAWKRLGADLIQDEPNAFAGKVLKEIPEEMREAAHA